MTTDTLDSLTDAQLSEVFAAEVAGWRRVCYCGDYFESHHVGSGHSPVEMIDDAGPRPDFATDANAVLPWLEKYGGFGVSYDGQSWWVSNAFFRAKGETLAGAVCKFLIRAKRASKCTAP